MALAARIVMGVCVVALCLGTIARASNETSSTDACHLVATTVRAHSATKPEADILGVLLLSTTNWLLVPDADRDVTDSAFARALLSCAKASGAAAAAGPKWGADVAALYDVWSSNMGLLGDAGAPGPSTAITTPQVSGLGLEWQYIGPFLHGKTEYDGDALASPLHPALRIACTAESPLLGITAATIGCLAHVRAASVVLRSALAAAGVAKVVAIPSDGQLFAVASETSTDGVVKGFLGLRGTDAWKPQKRASTLSTVNVAVAHNELGQLVQSLSDMGVMEFVGWAYTTVMVESPGPGQSVNLDLHAPGVHSLFYTMECGNFTAVAADQYHRRYVFPIMEPLRARKGRMVPLQIFARLRGAGQANFAISIVARNTAKPSLRLHAPLFLPDFVVGGFFGATITNPGLHPRGTWIAVPTSVAGAVTAARHIKFTVTDASGLGTVYCANRDCAWTNPLPDFAEVTVRHDDIQRRRYREAVKATIAEETAAWRDGAGSSFVGSAGLLPGLTLPLRIFIAVTRQPKRNAGCAVGAINISATAQLESGEQVTGWVTTTLRCRDATQEAFMFTHIARDGSLVGAAARYPILRNEDAANLVVDRVPVVLTLHGTGVTAQSQADSYKVGRKAGFVYGVKGAWVVAADRHGAHNWEGIGRLTALAALFHVADASQSLRALSQNDTPFADASRVIYAGHSMGGHGALHVAALDPDRAIGVMLLAPWITKEHYSTANTIFGLDRSRVDGVLRGQLEASIAGNDPDLVIANIRHVPVLIRVGANDRTVHPFFARRIRRLLVDAGNREVTYDEVPNHEHWWWDTVKTNDGGCMNDKTIRSWLNSVLTAPQRLLQSREIHAVSVESIPCTLGLCISAQRQPNRPSAIKVTRSTDEAGLEVLTVTTENVDALTWYTPDEGRVNASRVAIDGRDFTAAGSSCSRAQTHALEDTACDDGRGDSHTAATSTVRLCRQASAGWQRCRASDELHPMTLRLPFRAYSERALAVRIERDSPAIVVKYAVFLANLHWVAYDSFVPIVVGDDVEAASRSTFIVALSKNVGSQVARMTLADRREVGLLESVTWDEEALVASVTAGSFRSLVHAIVDIGLPTVPPMMRCPFCNMLTQNSTSNAARAHLGWASMEL